MRILIANDHGGLDLKWKLKDHLAKKHEVVNIGVDTDDRVDYPDISEKACSEFLKPQFLEGDNYDFGILICGTGIGISIAANKIMGVRCALLHDEYTAKMAKSHNNANFIALGSRNSHPASVNKLVQVFIETEFSSEQRHADRLDQIKLLELKQFYTQ